MLGNSFNLVDLIKGHLTDDFTTRLSSVLGENREKTQAGLNAAVPSLLAGLGNVASTSDGAQRLASAVDNSDDSILGSLGGLFSKGYSIDSGLGILRSIMGGGGLSEFTGNLGKFSGLSGRTVSSLLGFLVPVVLGGLKRAMRTGGLASSDIPSLLSSQRANIAAAMPSGIAETLGEVTEEPYATPRAASRSRMTETYSGSRPETPRPGWLAWILPLALVAGALGLIWHLASRPTVQAGREETRTTERARGLNDEMKFRGQASLDALRAKYQSVFREAQAQGVQLSSVRVQDGKLVLQGTAPSLEAANKVWAEIKRVNPGLDEIVADFSVASSLAPALTPPESSSEAAESGTAESSTQTYTVKAGDTLSSISKQFYGNAKDYTRIFDANQKQIGNKNVIKIGQELMIPMN
jgi:LysM repeat protein